MVIVKKRGKFDIKPPERYNESAMQSINRKSNPFVIGLTGNIGSGKSVVLNMLRHMGALGIDADGLTGMAYMHPCIVADIKKRFGDKVSLSREEIDRRALARIVFQDARALADLEAILHPSVTQLAQALIPSATLSVVVIEAIKLLESDLAALCDSIWVVDADEATVMQRLQSQRGMTEAEIWERLANQSPVSKKIKKADVIIKNDGNREQTWAQIHGGWNELISKNTHFKQCNEAALALTAPFASHFVMPFSGAAQRIADLRERSIEVLFTQCNMKTDADNLESLICEKFFAAGCDVMDDTQFSVWELSLSSLSPCAFIHFSGSKDKCGGLIESELMEKFAQMHQAASLILPVKLPLIKRDAETLTSNGYIKIDSSSDAHTHWVNAGYNVFQKQFWDEKAFITSVIE